MIYLPGLHGDWGLIGAFRRALGGRVRFVEVSYPLAPQGLEELAAAVEKALTAVDVRSGWFLAQSFGSQVGWELLRRGFKADGVILAGGFVRHPAPWGAAMMRPLLDGPWSAALRPPYRAMTWLGGALSRRDPDSARELAAFAAGRTVAQWKAAAWRLRLVATSDPRHVARATAIPVWYLGGAVDLLVPWPWVVGWLARECPGYRGKTVFPWADHNVLGSAPKESARQILEWLGVAVER
ncbi:MAG: alpha/beta hydrolase [Elusimicrobia bacterium]|nr:alpha/beta hydrolase [Elusimicrobiota bacterium]MDE2510967.1 alpha/beta hydrolase [Elusimicrobiota bacterium]